MVRTRKREKIKLVDFYSPTTNEKILVNRDEIVYIKRSDIYRNATSIFFSAGEWLTVKGNLDEINKKIQE